MEALLAVRRGGVLPRPLRWTRGAVCGGTHGSRPTLYYFVGQGPRTLPGVRWLSGGRGKAPPLRSVGFAGPGDRKGRPYGWFLFQKASQSLPPAGGKKLKSFFTATCAWGKIPLSLQVWNFCAQRKNYARSRLQTPLAEKTKFFRQLQKGRRDAPPFLISGFITPGYPWPRPWGRRTRGRTCCRTSRRRQGRSSRPRARPR